MSSLTPLTLEAVEKQFSDWRANKQGDKKIPQSLWDQVNKLSDMYNLSLVLRRLKISTQQARDKGIFPKPLLNLDIDQKIAPPFIKIPMPALAAPTATIIPTITLQRAEMTLSLHHPTDGQIHLFINMLMR